MTTNVRVFVGDTFKGTGRRENAVVAGVLDLLKALGAEVQFSAEGRSLSLLDEADAVVLIRTGPCERAAFEAAYNLFGGRRAPMFVAQWKHARNLAVLEGAEPVLFEWPEELRGKLQAFLNRAAAGTRDQERRMIRIMEQLVA